MADNTQGKPQKEERRLTLQQRLARAQVPIIVKPLVTIDTPYEIRRPTGILSLDIALRGGFPGGSLNQIFGPDGSGKDYLTNLMIKEQQRIHENDARIAWMTFGYWPDKSLMFDLCGVRDDIGMLDLITLDVGKDAKEMPSETLLEGILETIRMKDYQLIIMNELASGETKDEVAKKIGKTRMIGNWATLMSQFCKKMYSALRENNPDGSPNQTTIMEILPVRANLDAYESQFHPYEQTAGYALRHAKAIDLHLLPGPPVMRESIGPKGAKKKTIVGKTVRWVVSKGKHGISEGASGSWNFIFNQGIDMVLDTANCAKAYGTIRAAGKYTYINGLPEKIEGGFDKAVEYLRTNPELVAQLRTETVAVAMSATEQVVTTDVAVSDAETPPTNSD